MATKKTSTAVATRRATAGAVDATSWRDRMAALRTEAIDQEASTLTGNFLQFRTSGMLYAGNPVANNTIPAIIVDSVLENAYYDGPYDPNNLRSPVCYAFGRRENDMAPHEESKEPQCETCAGCEMNKFKSADNGKAKACKNQRRLALLPADQTSLDKGLEGVEHAFAKLPPTSIRNYAAYVKLLGARGLAPQQVITQITLVPDAKTQFSVQFQLVEELPDALLGAVLQKKDEIGDAGMMPAYPPPEDAPPPPPARNARATVAPKGRQQAAAAPAGGGKRGNFRG